MDKHSPTVCTAQGTVSIACDRLWCPELSHTISVIQSRSILRHQSQKSGDHSRQPSCSSLIPIHYSSAWRSRDWTNTTWVNEWVMLASSYHPPRSFSVTTAVSALTIQLAVITVPSIAVKIFLFSTFSPLMTTSLSLQHIQGSSMFLCGNKLSLSSHPIFLSPFFHLSPSFFKSL